MPDYTENYRLIKPKETEYYNVEDQNKNMDMIDSSLKVINTDISNVDEKLESEIKECATHKGNQSVHITDLERGNWNNTISAVEETKKSLENYQPLTRSLSTAGILSLEDKLPIFSSIRSTDEKVSLQALKDALGVTSPTIRVVTHSTVTLTCEKDSVVLSGTGATIFQIPEIGVWNITATLGNSTRKISVKVEGAIQYEADLRFLSSISITSPAKKTAYINQDSFEPEGLIVTATFEDSSKADVTKECIYSPRVLTDGVTQVMYSITIAGISDTANQNVSVDRIKIETIPSQGGSLTYTGESLTPVWVNYDPTMLNISGVQNSVNAGSYTTTFTPTARYKWLDNSIAQKEVSWTINKAAPGAKLSASSLSLTYNNKSGTITVTRNGTGAITASSSDTSVARVSVSGTTVTVTSAVTDSKPIGTATITINVAAGTNHTAQTGLKCSVNVDVISKTLNDNSWAVIKYVSDNDLGKKYWKLGDNKLITINGKVVNTTYTNLSVGCQIIGFNHNSSIEGTNRIHFQIGTRELTKTKICLLPVNYHANNTSVGFLMNTSATNRGGWNSCYMRRSVLGGNSTPSSPASNTLLAALPTDLRSVMKSVIKYTDNVGGGSTSSNSVTQTTEYLFSPSEFEMIGELKRANPREQNYQQQYEFYSSGNKIERDGEPKNNGQNTKFWFSRSPVGEYDEDRWVLFYDNSSGSIRSDANDSEGISPIFCV